MTPSEGCGKEWSMWNYDNEELDEYGECRTDLLCPSCSKNHSLSQGDVKEKVVHKEPEFSDLPKALDSGSPFILSEKVDLIKINKFGVILSKDVIQVEHVKEFIRLLKEDLRNNCGTDDCYCCNKQDKIIDKRTGDLK